LHSGRWSIQEITHKTQAQQQSVSTEVIQGLIKQRKAFEIFASLQGGHVSMLSLCKEISLLPVKKVTRSADIGKEENMKLSSTGKNMGQYMMAALGHLGRFGSVS